MPECSKTAVDHFTYGQLKELMGKEGFQEVLDFFTADTHQAIKNLSAAIAQQQADYVGAVCHKLKSSSRLMGAFAMAEWCGRLEEYAENKNHAVAAQSYEQLKAEFQRVKVWIKVEADTEAVAD